MSTINKIIEVLKEYRDFDPASVTKETTFKSLGLHSLDTVDIVMKLEGEFGMEIPMSEELNSVGAVVNFIDKAKK